MILGLTGNNGAGKGVAADFLKERSFAYHSLSDVIREEITSSGQEISRERLVATGNELRGRCGPAVLAERILERLPHDRHAIVDSIRHPAEVQALRKRRDFVLLAIDAEPRLRFERLRARGREHDPRTYEEFLDLDAREARSASEFGQQVEGCRELADFSLRNDGSLAEFHLAVKSLVLELLMNQRRPGWDGLKSLPGLNADSSADTMA